LPDTGWKSPRHKAKRTARKVFSSKGYLPKARRLAAAQADRITADAVDTLLAYKLTHTVETALAAYSIIAAAALPFWTIPRRTG
jgi:hypothetical protein